MNTALFSTNTAIAVLSALALVYLCYAVYQHQKQKQQNYWANQFRNFMTSRGIIQWGEAQFIPNNPKEEYVIRMTGFRSDSRYWVSLNEAWLKRVKAVEED